MKVSHVHPSLIAVMFALGCAGTDGDGDGRAAEQSQELAAAEADRAAPDARHEGPRRGPPRDYERRGPHGGPEGLFVVALHELDLGDEQRATIESALRSLHDEAGPPPDMQAMHAQLAAAVRSGSVDPSRFEGDAHADRKQARRDRLASALDTLHDTLTAEQRGEVVAFVRSKAPPEPKERGERKAKAGKRGHGIERLLHGVEVTDAQRAKIEEALERAGLDERKDPRAHHEAMTKAREAMLTAFASDSFDAADVLPEPPPGAGPQRMIEALAVVVPILDQAQREELADRIAKGPQHGPKRRRG
jgi:Spy/CpxP family protein refolding chaperone